MGKPGIIAFPVLLALGAITGYLTYTYFTAAIPQEGVVNSPYRKELTASGTNETNKSSKQVDESKFSKVVTIKILKGAVTQGSPDFDPDPATASSERVVRPKYWLLGRVSINKEQYWFCHTHIRQ